VRVEWIANPAIKDVSDVNFKIAAPFVTVAQPNGGQIWVRGTNQTFTWTHNLGASEFVKIELSTDGGATWPHVLIASTPSDGSQLIKLPMVVSTTCRARVTWLDNPAVSDTSNANFRIKAP
jgi:hypothetical protein